MVKNDHFFFNKDYLLVSVTGLSIAVNAIFF